MYNQSHQFHHCIIFDSYSIPFHENKHLRRKIVNYFYRILEIQYKIFYIKFTFLSFEISFTNENKKTKRFKQSTLIFYQFWFR